MSDLRTAAKQALEACKLIVSAFDALKPASAARNEPLQINAARASITALEAALADPGSDYERGFVDGMLEQARRSVDKAVNAMAEPIIKPEIKDDKPVPPPEAQTEAEKIAYCAGWWAALEAERKELLRISEKQQ